MKKKGFTLVELVGVIVIISLIAILAVPQIINQVRRKQNELSDVTKELFYSATSLYLDANKNKYEDYASNVYCISLRSLLEDEFLTEPIIDTKTRKKVDLDTTIEVKIDEKLNKNYSVVNARDCKEVLHGSAPAPVLASGMIPVRWDYANNKWVKADTSNPSATKWYDYNSKLWANAVYVTEDTRSIYQAAKPGYDILEEHVLAYFVWVPRYKYRLWSTGTTSNPETIEIAFEDTNVSKSIGTKTGEWLTHPAFTFGDKEVNGLWVGKFETTGDINNLTVKPNQNSISNQNLNSMFNAVRKMEDANNIYGIDGTKVDTHIMKNTEWGAVAYLAHSNYGANSQVALNNVYNETNTITGCSSGTFSTTTTSSTCTNPYNTGVGALSSTTSNISGIYDMAGGKGEFVMGNMLDNNNNFYPSNSGLVNPVLKYYDAYKYSTNAFSYERGKLGDATKEVLTKINNDNGSWYDNKFGLPSNTNSWIVRGGDAKNPKNSGIFASSNSNGGVSENTFRVVIVPEQEKVLYAESNLNGANPELYQGMIPVVFDSLGTVKVADQKKEWYNYANKNWANAVLVDVSNTSVKNKYFNSDMTLKDNIAGQSIQANEILMYYVWIPRYRYQLFNTNNTPVAARAINVVFENKSTTKSRGNANNEWLTHPSFTFGTNELNGIWVGKFETTGSASNLTILPNSQSYTNQTLDNFFNQIRGVETNTKYGLNTSEVDTHIMKNTDWGAAAYLAQSNYGLCTNNTCKTVAVNHIQTVSGGPTITGCSSGVKTATVVTSTTCPDQNKWYTMTGQTASTTQNVTGIYDMAGGAWDRVMGIMYDASGTIPGFSANIDPKYYDAYAYLASGESSTRGLLGDATRETLLTNNVTTGAWNGEFSAFPIGNENFFFRSGWAGNHQDYLGIFAYSRAGQEAHPAYAVRMVITKD